jgi:hypothetical protein
MNFNIKDYKDVINHLNYFIELDNKMKIENENKWMIEFEGIFYMINDNGGEINVFSVNYDEGGSVPHTSNKIEVSSLVLSYRIAKFLKEGWSSINWGVEESDIVKVLDQYQSREAVMYELRRD